MTAGKVLMTALKIVAVCLVFALCSVVGGALSGLNKIGQQAPPAQQAVSSEPQASGGPQAPQTPEIFSSPSCSFSSAPESFYRI